MKQYIEAIKDYDMAIKFNCKDKCALENKKSALKMLKKLKWYSWRLKNWFADP